MRLELRAGGRIDTETLARLEGSYFVLQIIRTEGTRHNCQTSQLLSELIRFSKSICSEHVLILVGWDNEAMRAVSSVTVGGVCSDQLSVWTPDRLSNHFGALVVRRHDD